MLAERRQAKKKVMACFIDVRKAYDRVWRDGLWKALWQKGVRGKMWRVIKNYYRKVQSAVRLDEGNTEWFDVDVGVRQGCVISPMLFDVFVDRLAREVRALNLGVPAAGKRLSLLLYADDIVLLADSQEELQRMLGAVQAFCRRWRVQVNMSKTKVMAFGASGVKNLHIVWEGKKLEEVAEYKYLGLMIEKRGSWKKEKEKMLRKAKRAAAMAWTLAVRAGDMSVKGMNNMWTALVRPHLEYGAEVLSMRVWEDAEKVMRKVGRRVLKCGNRLPNDAIVGELGWMSMRGRRMLLRLSYWGKVLAMDGQRWVKRVYEHGRARLEGNANANTWCKLTREWLLELGLDAEWNAQAVGPEWQEKVRGMIVEREARLWRLRAVKNAKLEEYVRWKHKPGMEEYLMHPMAQQRRLWTKMRGGCLELRIETGRWERLTVSGVQVLVPRRLRRCKLCFGGVEDARHVLFCCPAYRQTREGWASTVCQTAPPAVAMAAKDPQGKGNEDVVMKWMMQEGGERAGMQMLADVWRERRELLGERAWGIDQSQ